MTKGLIRYWIFFLFLFFFSYIFFNFWIYQPCQSELEIYIINSPPLTSVTTFQFCASLIFHFIFFCVSSKISLNPAPKVHEWNITLKRERKKIGLFGEFGRKNKVSLEGFEPVIEWYRAWYPLKPITLEEDLRSWSSPNTYHSYRKRPRSFRRLRRPPTCMGHTLLQPHHHHHRSDPTFCQCPMDHQIHFSGGWKQSGTPSFKLYFRTSSSPIPTFGTWAPFRGHRAPDVGRHSSIRPKFVSVARTVDTVGLPWKDESHFGSVLITLIMMDTSLSSFMGKSVNDVRLATMKMPCGIPKKLLRWC